MDFYLNQMLLVTSQIVCPFWFSVPSYQQLKAFLQSVGLIFMYVNDYKKEIHFMYQYENY